MAQVYDPDLFERTRLYAIAVRKCSHPEVVAYVQQLTQSLKVRGSLCMSWRAQRACRGAVTACCLPAGRPSEGHTHEGHRRHPRPVGACSREACPGHQGTTLLILTLLSHLACNDIIYISRATTGLQSLSWVDLSSTTLCSSMRSCCSRTSCGR